MFRPSKGQGHNYSGCDEVFSRLIRVKEINEVEKGVEFGRFSHAPHPEEA